MKGLLDSYYNNRKIRTILGKGASFHGDMNFKYSLKINGSFIGNIETSGFLIVGEGALVEADVSADSIVVAGTVNGDIYARERVEMLSTGRVYGNIKAKKIKISDGVIFNGRCEMIK